MSYSDFKDLDSLRTLGIRTIESVQMMGATPESPGIKSISRQM